MSSFGLLLLTVALVPLAAAAYRDYEKATAALKEAKELKEQLGQCGCMFGPAGQPGVPGVPGMPGKMGLDGKRGTQGDSGTKGEHGTPGLTGTPGPIGPSGHRGRKGIDGEPGGRGEDGLKGQKGERGYSGLPGQKGGKGEAAQAPKKVAFSVGRSQKLGPVLQDTTITFDTIFVNVGGGFDEYSSQFVCHVNGTYLFTTHVMGQLNKNVYAWIMHNTKHRVPLHGDGRAGYGTGSQTVLLSLKQDDHVWLQLTKDSAILNDYSTFSGYLIFEEDPETSSFEPESTNSRYWFRK